MNHRAAVLILSLAGMITACKSEEQKRAEETAKNLEQASKQMAEASKKPAFTMSVRKLAFDCLSLGPNFTAAAKSMREASTIV